MKKIIVMFALLAPFVAQADFQTNLSYGMTGGDVYQLQDVLQEQGCLNHSSTGYFGILTLNAVKCYQTNYGIPSTGYVGVLTRASLNAMLEQALASSTEAQMQELATNPMPQTNDVPVTPVAPSQPLVGGIPHTPFFLQVTSPWYGASTKPFIGAVHVTSNKHLNVAVSYIQSNDGTTTVQFDVLTTLDQPGNACVRWWRDSDGKTCGQSFYWLRPKTSLDSPDFNNADLTLVSEDGDTLTVRGNFMNLGTDPTTIFDNNQ